MRIPVKQILGIGLILIIIAGVSAWNLRKKVDQHPRGTDIVYQVNDAGDAKVVFAEKIYFLEQSQVDQFQKKIEKQKQGVATPYQENEYKQMVKKIAQQPGHEKAEAKDFHAYLEKQDNFGSQILTFTWTNFAFLNQEGIWEINYSFAKDITMNENSSISIVLPSAANVIKVVPQPDAVEKTKEGQRLSWHGARDMPWPLVNYKL